MLYLPIFLIECALLNPITRQALLANLTFLRRMSGHKAEEYLEKLHKEGRFHQDVWSV